MKTSRFSDQEIAFVLRQAEEGTAVAEVCRKAGISEATYYVWRKKCQWRRDFPQKWRRKIPQLGGRAISRGRDRRIYSLRAGRGASGLLEWDWQRRLA